MKARFEKEPMKKIGTIVNAGLLKRFEEKCKLHKIKINEAIEFGMEAFLEYEIKKEKKEK